MNNTKLKREQTIGLLTILKLKEKYWNSICPRFSQKRIKICYTISIYYVNLFLFGVEVKNIHVDSCPQNNTFSLTSSVVQLTFNNNDDPPTQWFV